MNEQSEASDEGGKEQIECWLLSTKRLTLRMPRVADIPELVKLANNRRIAEQTRRMPYPFGEDEARAWIEMAAASPDDRAFIVTRRSDGSVLGAAGCAAMDEAHKEVGYWIGEPHWGKGYATEALRAVIDHVFEAQDLERLYGRCRVVNSASRKVLVKCGFQLVGSGMCDSRVLKGLVPVEEFVLERSVWSSLRQWGKSS
jgi:RimJ/RimL family protein N-acetyltransferase